MEKRLFYRKVLSLTLGMLLLPNSSYADLQQIQVLIEVGEAQQAYKIAQEIYDDQVGEPEFDFVYALAAIEAGVADKAIFPLERLILDTPQNNRARLELARAHYLLGDFIQAREQFDKVRATEPPAHVLRNIDRFLAQMAQEEGGSKARVAYSVGATVGHDSNINASTSDANFDVGAFTVALGETSRAIASDFLQYELGVDYSYQAGEHATAFAHGHFSDRLHDELDDFNLRTLSGTAGWQFDTGQNSFRFPVSIARNFLQEEAYRLTLTGAFEWLYREEEQDTYLSLLQVGRHDYSEDPLQNMAFVVGALMWSRTFYPLPLVFTANFVHNQEAALQEAGRHNGKSGFNGLLKLQWKPRPTQALTLSVYGGEVRYRETHPVFAVRRKDTAQGASLAWLWQLSPHLSLSADVSYSDNKSNITVYTYDRWVVSSGLRYVFF